MAFRKQILDGQRAAARAIGLAMPAMCLTEVWQALGSPESDHRYPYSNATQARKRAAELGAIKGYDINDAPDGSILFWSNVIIRRQDMGHIAFKQDGMIKTIDAPTRGRWGLISVKDFRRKWPWLKFEGYAYGAGAFLGHTIVVASDLEPAVTPLPSKVNATPFETGEDVALIYIRDKATKGKGAIFQFNEASFQKRSVPSDQWTILRAVTPTIKVVEVAASTLNAIPGR